MERKIDLINQIRFQIRYFLLPLFVCAWFFFFFFFSDAILIYFLLSFSIFSLQKFPFFSHTFILAWLGAQFLQLHSLYVLEQIGRICHLTWSAFPWTSDTCLFSAAYCSSCWHQCSKTAKSRLKKQIERFSFECRMITVVALVLHCFALHGSYRLKELLFKEFSRTFPGLNHKIQGVHPITAFT